MNYKEYLQSPGWIARRDAALERAEHRCQVCNSADNLNVHHRTYENIFNERQSDLTVLCRTCHSLFHERVESEPAGDYVPATREMTNRMLGDFYQHEAERQEKREFENVAEQFNE